ncbi:SEL1-like repeat protein [Patescibacteria group bacterium]|nr:SEL1-like repeat protein [Patescibacteria group bacterium]
MFEEQLRMAKMGIPDMMIGVAYAYEFGMGVEKNITEAIKWYEKAGDSESIERAKNLKSLGGKSE